MEGKALRNAALAALVAACVAAPPAAFADASGTTDVTIVAPNGNPGQVTYVVDASQRAGSFSRTGDAAPMAPALAAVAASSAALLSLAARDRREQD